MVTVWAVIQEIWFEFPALQQPQVLSLANHWIPGHLGHLHLGKEGERKEGSKEEREWTALSQLAHLLSSNMYFIPVIQHYRSVPNHKHWIVILDSPLCVTAPYGQKVCIFNHLSWKSRWKCAFGTAGQTSRPFWKHVLWVTKQIN